MLKVLGKYIKIVVLLVPIICTSSPKVFADFGSATYGACSYGNNCPASNTNSSSSSQNTTSTTIPTSTAAASTSTKTTSASPSTTKQHATFTVGSVGGSDFLVSSGTTSNSLTSSLMVSTSLPTIKGTAPANAQITVSVHTKIVTCVTYSDINGNWSCTFTDSIPDGTHTVLVSALTSSNETITLPGFSIKVVPKPIGTITTASKNNSVNRTFSYFILFTTLIIMGIFTLVFLGKIKNSPKD